MKNPIRRPLALGAVGVVAAATLLPALPATATVGPSVPGGLKVVRTGADASDLAISWKAASGVDHYTVSVFDGTRDHAQVLPASATSFTYDGSGVCTRYRVKVSAVAPDGAMATTNDFLVSSLAPGGPQKMVATRTESGAAGTVSWAAPQSVVDGYRVKVTNMATGQALVDETTTTTSLALRDLDPSRQYSVKVTPFNSYGTCFTGTSVLYGAKPAQPATFAVLRDAATPSRVDITWTPPAWSGYGPVTEYEIGYGTGRVTDWVPVPASARSHTLVLDPNRNHVFLMRAISSNDRGHHTKVIKLLKHGAPGTPAVDPQVTVSEADGTITVHTVGPVGSSASYPKMTVKVEPTLNKGTFRDEHVIANGASQTVFTQVPCGVYTVTVTGFGPGLAKEFGRKVVNRCDTGLVPADLWKVVYGQATIKGNTVDVTTSGERRIMSTTKRTSQDMVLTTTAALHTGWGYGVWARANLTNGAAVTGYSFQYDPGYENVNKAFGKALLLRLWSNGKECGTPLAKVPFPAGVDVYAPHDIMVVVKGDTLYATIDGTVVFNVDSLKDAVAKNGCGMPAPSGSEIGFRTWNSSTATFTNTTLS